MYALSCGFLTGVLLLRVYLVVPWYLKVFSD
jgi:hypothetical protein